MKNRHSFKDFISAYRYGDKMSKFEMALLCLVSAVCAACNVLLPYLQKVILENIGHDNSDNALLWVYLLVGIGGAVALAFENFINVAIMMRLRRGIERAMLYSLTYKEQPLLKQKGVGVFASTAVGNAEQLSRVLAAGWFSIIFNLIGAVVSIIISATWNQYFLVIVLIAYVLVLLVIYIFNGISVHYYYKEKVLSYQLIHDVRESVKSHRSIMSFGSYDGYQQGLKDDFILRRKYYTMSENMANLSTALIRLIQAVALAVFFFFAVNELRSGATSEQLLHYPVLVALVSYFATIFVPVTSINATYNNALKFRAFYDPFNEIVTFPGLGSLPGNLNLDVIGVEAIENNVLILGGVDFVFDKSYGIVGLHGESKAAFLSFLRGENSPEVGKVTLAGVPLHEIEKNLRLGLVSISPGSGEVFEQGLEFNVTLGKPLLTDREYSAKREEYFAFLHHFFELIDAGCTFKRKKDREIIAQIVRDFYSLDSTMRDNKFVHDSIIATFYAIEDRDEFIETIGDSIFSKKYAKRSRYEKILSELSLYSLENREFGISGNRLLEAERSLILLARFLLPENQNPYVMLSPLEHVPFEIYGSAVNLIREFTKGRPGVVLMSDVDAMRTICDEMVVMEGGHIVERGKHANLIRRKTQYAKIYAESTKKK